MSTGGWFVFVSLLLFFLCGCRKESLGSFSAYASLILGVLVVGAGWVLRIVYPKYRVMAYPGGSFSQALLASLLVLVLFASPLCFWKAGNFIRKQVDKHTGEN